MGVLNRSDLQKEFGSSAVIEYQSYIQNPEQTRHETSRRLTSRYCDNK